MTKLCSVCSTDNKDDAQFCRACGTAFTALPASPAAAPSEAEQLAAGITCDECGFQNKPGVRYCANCGVSLLGTVIVPRSRVATPPAIDDTFSGSSPPPISYPSFAPVAPYPPAPSPSAAASLDDPLAGFAPVFSGSQHAPSEYPPADDELPATPDIPDADAAIAVREREAMDAGVGPGAVPPAAKRAPLLVGVGVLVLAIAGAAAWWFMSGSGRNAPAPAVAASAPEPVPAAAVAPAASEATAAPTIQAAAAASENAASGPPPLIAPGEILVPANTPPPTAGSASPFNLEPSDAAASEAEAKRIAADKRREKAAKDKADREARAKASADQQAATARAEQDALAKRRAEEVQRPRPVVNAPPAPTAAPAQPRGVREICAGRGTIAEAVCQSRECGSAEHANEAVCRQVRDAEERRRNYSN